MKELYKRFNRWWQEEKKGKFIASPIGGHDLTWNWKHDTSAHNKDDITGTGFNFDLKQS